MYKERILELLATNQFVKLLGIEFLEINEGYAKAKLDMNKNLLNSYNIMHGGAIFSLADTVAGISAMTYGNCCTTVNANINYMLPVADVSSIYCTGKVIRHGHKISVTSFEITDENNNLLQNGTITYYNMKEKL